MKKIDFHIHTIATDYDDGFLFDLDVLKSYVETLNIDAIAVTNHNVFDEDQYIQIAEELSPTVKVFPGIEIHIGKNVGHIIVIADPNNVSDFAKRCKAVAEMMLDGKGYINAQEFKDVFTNPNHYITIPHYKKSPEVSRDIMKELDKYIVCGEVSSPKKFMYCKKDVKTFPPVLFSDYRPTKGIEPFPLRQVYLNINTTDFSTIKYALKDRDKIWLTNKKGRNMFQALPDLDISTGLTVVIGGRSSGKTYTLNQISERLNDVKYIKQFALLETEKDNNDKDFKEKIEAKESDIAKEYLSPFADVIKDVKRISLEKNEEELSTYISSLLANAQEAEREDVYSRCYLYNETKYLDRSFGNLQELIDSVKTLLDNSEHRELIDKHISKDSLIALLQDLVSLYRSEKELSLKELYVNDIVSTIRRQLRKKTAGTPIEDVDFYRIFMDDCKIKKFTKIVKALKQEGTISEKSIGEFSIKVDRKPYKGAGEMRAHSHSQKAFKEAFNLYENPYQFLQGLSQIDGLPESDYCEYFTNINYQLLNKYGLPVSGGDRAEFNLLQELDDAYRYEMLLIDEPESSFDNIFLRTQVNEMLKDISQQLPVIVVTHNNTVGMSIRPDYIIHTKRIINNDGKVSFKRFTGYPGEKRLASIDGEEVKSRDIALDCFEAGEDTYKERGDDYEMLKD